MPWELAVEPVWTLCRKEKATLQNPYRLSDPKGLI
jgi:hypothetical protein